MKHRSKLKVLVGDRVRVTSAHGHGGGETIESVCERHSVLKRRAPGKSKGERAVAANVDRVVVVGAAATPDWDQHLMDRFVVVGEANDLPVIVVVNKTDLVESAASIVDVYDRVGYQTISASVVSGAGIEELKKALKDGISLVTGPTGVGKSSLLNAVKPGLSLRTGEVSEKTGAGRHTTVAAEMFRLADGAYVVDTPGLRDIGLWGVDPGDVNRAFPEILEESTRCRFADCRHVAEPECAVVRAAAAGEISSARLESYRKFLAEAAEASKHWK